METNGKTINTNINWNTTLSLKETQKNNKSNNRCVENTLINCSYICKMYKLDKECIYLRMVTSDPDFLPNNKMDKLLEEWAGKGWQVYSQMITNSRIDSFGTLATEFNIGNNFFKYLQIKSHLMKQRRTESDNAWATGIYKQKQ